jgi:hypothetical protein
MPGRGRQTFNKRLKEQQRKERQQEKFAKRQERKLHKGTEPATDTTDLEPGTEPETVQEERDLPLQNEEQAS